MDLPDTYRGEYRDEETAGEKYGAQAETLVHNIQNRGAKVGALLLSCFFVACFFVCMVATLSSIIRQFDFSF